MKLIARRIQKIKEEPGDANPINSLGYAIYYLDYDNTKMYGIIWDNYIWDNYPNTVIMTLDSKVGFLSNFEEIELDISDNLEGNIIGSELENALQEFLKFF